MLLLLCLHLVLQTSMVAHTGGAGCPASNNFTLTVGGVVDRGSRMGREQEIAMKIAIEDVNNQESEDCSNHYKLKLHLLDSHRSSTSATSFAAIMKLIDEVKVDSLLGRLHFLQAAMISDIDEKATKIPLILLNPTALTPPLVQLQEQNLIQMSDDIRAHAQCIAAIVGLFRWSKVTIIYEQGAFALNSGVITILSDALKSVEATVEHYWAFTSSSLDLADRYEWTDFTQPYVKSGLALVVPQKADTTKETWMFMEVFELKMWILIPSTSLFIGFVVWLIEHGDNPEFGEGSISKQIGTVLWFSFAVLFFAQNESLRRNLSKLVLAPWVFLILMLTANFTAALTSKLTVAQLKPSVDIDTLKRESANIGCNMRSFPCKYLVDVLHIKPRNIRMMKSIDDYPRAFQRGDIKADAFVTEHASVFLEKHCRGFTLLEPTFTFGGLGFAFQKGSPLTVELSRAILRTIESGEVKNMENDLLSKQNCSSANDDTSGLGFQPFSGLFYVSGGIAATLFLITITQIKRMLGLITEVIFRKRSCNETCSVNKASSVLDQYPTASGSGQIL